MTKCEKCKKAKFILDEKPEKIECTVTGKKFIYGQRVNCPDNQGDRK